MPLQTFSMTVLLVDDQKIIAEAIKRMLVDQSDITFCYCSDPMEALKMANDFKPTIILQDLVMPNIDGIELVKRYRVNPSTSDIPIIVLSSKEDPQVKAEAFACGANDYLVKLPDRVELIARIRYHSNAYIRLLERNLAFKKLEESQKLLHGELAEAAAYVRSLLPSPQEKPMEINWLFIPSTQLGGDAFGYHWLDDKNFALYLLDVCGHGVGAALHSISVVNVLRSLHLSQADFWSPKSVLKELNRTFRMENHHNMFLTIWYGIYNRETKQILYASGGHPPAILFTGKSKDSMKIHKLKTDGIAIGIDLDADFENDTCQVEEFNRFFLYSDGVFEVQKGNGLMMNLDEFVDLLSSMCLGEGMVLDKMLLTIQNIQGKKEFADDFSLLEAKFDFT